MPAFLIPIIIVALAIVAIVVFLCCIYKVADVDKALIITGGKEPIIKVSGGSFVIPIFRKAQFFDLCMLTVSANRDEIKTQKAVPIVVDWTAQIRPNTQDVNVLKKAIISFKERTKTAIEDDVRLTIMGAVRGVVATLTPEQVQGDKETFKEAIVQSVFDELNDMGFELVSLNIQDITDNNGYYDDIAAVDREEKRKEAERVKAIANQQIRQQAADSEKVARQSELDSELEIAEKAKNNDLKKSAFKIETDKARADAEVAGELQRTVREQEIAEQEGRVEVVRQEQANLAATKEKEVIATRAEAEKEKQRIEAEATANVRRIAAESRVQVAEKEATAITIAAEADATKRKTEGQAIADVTKQTGSAEAEVARLKGTTEAEIVKQKGLAEVDVAKQNGIAEASVTKEKGLAEAEVAKQKGLAEAEAERAKLMAQADGEKALADARASNEKVNFEIEKLKIEAEARVTIATKTAEVMAEIGKNAEFVNIGGSASGNGALNSPTGNVLTDTLTSIPVLMKTLNAENEALNGKPINDEVKGLVESILGPVKGMLSTSETTNTVPVEDTTSTPVIEEKTKK
jgi:flotillin